MAQFASDSFAGTAGTELSAYNAAWSKVSGITGNAQLVSTGRVRMSSFTTTGYYHSASPASADYSVSADFYYAGSLSGTAGVLARCSTSAQTFYLFRHTMSGQTVELYKYVAGVATQLGSGVAQSLATGATINLKVEAIGSAIKGYVNGSGTAAISQTDSGISAAGKAGLRWNSSNASDSLGLHADNFSGDDTSVAGVSGSLAATEAGDDTASAAGAVLVHGALSAVEAGADSAALAGAVEVRGTVGAADEGADDAAAVVGAVLVAGDVSAAEGEPDGIEAAGAVLISGAVAANESGTDSAAIAGAAVVAVSGALSAAEAGADSAVLLGGVLVLGAVMAAEAGDDHAAIRSSPPASSTLWRYDVPAAGLRYDISGASMRYDIPGAAAALSI